MKIINSKKPLTHSGEVNLYITSDGSSFLRFINDCDRYYMMLTVQNTKYYKPLRYENEYLDSTAYTEFTNRIMFMANPDNTMMVEYKTRR